MVIVSFSFINPNTFLGDFKSKSLMFMVKSPFTLFVDESKLTGKL